MCAFMQFSAFMCNKTICKLSVCMEDGSDLRESYNVYGMYKLVTFTVSNSDADCYGSH